MLRYYPTIHAHDRVCGVPRSICCASKLLELQAASSKCDSLMDALNEKRIDDQSEAADNKLQVRRPSMHRRAPGQTSPRRRPMIVSIKLKGDEFNSVLDALDAARA